MCTIGGALQKVGLEPIGFERAFLSLTALLLLTSSLDLFFASSTQSASTDQTHTRLSFPLLTKTVPVGSKLRQVTLLLCPPSRTFKHTPTPTRHRRRAASFASLALQADTTTMFGLDRSRDCAVDARERISES